MNAIYTTKVVGIGASALSFLDEKMIIFFNKQAQDALAEYSILLDDLEGDGEIVPGSRLWLGDKSFCVTAVGEVANKNFRELGHAVIHFDGKAEAGLPGEIHVEDIAIPEIMAGLSVVFEKE